MSELLDKDNLEIKELDTIFKSFIEENSEREILAGTVKYFQFIEDSFTLSKLFKKILRSNPTIEIPISNLYKGLSLAWDNEPRGFLVEALLFDIHSAFRGEKSKYGLGSLDPRHIRLIIRILHESFWRFFRENKKDIYFEKFDNRKNTLIFNTGEVVVGKNTSRINTKSRLLKIICSKPTALWYNDLILEEWDKGNPVPDNIENQTHKFYNPALEINQLIKAKLGINDFLKFNTKEVKINPLYLRRNKKK